MTINDAYRVLGVTPGASADDVKRAYRRLVVLTVLIAAMIGRCLLNRLTARRCSRARALSAGSRQLTLPAPRSFDTSVLSPIQKYIAEALADGLAPKQIAFQLGVSHHSVQAQLAKTRRLTGATTSVHLAALVGASRSRQTPGIGHREQSLSGVSSRSAALTPRQLEVVALLADGLSMGEIGEVLGISHHTVAQHLHTMKRRLAVRTTVELVATFMHEVGSSAAAPLAIARETRNGAQDPLEPDGVVSQHPLAQSDAGSALSEETIRICRRIRRFSTLLPQAIRERQILEWLDHIECARESGESPHAVARSLLVRALMPIALREWVRVLSPLRRARR